MGDEEGRTPVLPESPLGYHPCNVGILTIYRDPVFGQCQVGSLTGAVASERVTEASKGSLEMVGNHLKEYKGKRELDCDRYIWSRYESRA